MKEQNSDEDIKNPQRKVVRSCKDSIGEDPIRQTGSSYQVIPQPRSAKNSVSEEQWQNLTATQRKQINQALIKNNIAEQAKVKKQKKRNYGGPDKVAEKVEVPSYKQPRNDRKFTENLDQSESVSNIQSSSQEQALENRISMVKTQKPQFFNLMLLGAASTGKTTYAQSFFRQHIQQMQQPIIKQPTTKITCYRPKQDLNPTNQPLKYQIIDTPGYTHSTAHKYCEMVKKQIERRIQVTEANRKHLLSMSSLYEKQERVLVDERVHCCLLFFRGVRLHSDDIYILQNLHTKAIIIPVIAKGDCYTVSQIHQLKANILQKSLQLNIQYFNIQQYIRQKHPFELVNIQNGPYGKSPPFMLVTSTNKIVQRNGEISTGREYKWGTCYVQNQQHTEFTLLNRLLVKYLYSGFIHMTNIRERKNQVQVQSVTAKIGKVLGFVAGIGTIIAIAKIIGHKQALKN